MIAPSIATVLGLLASNAIAQSNFVLSRDAPIGYARRFAAIGDSFAAGIGSGNSYHTVSNIGEKCSRYDGGYPVQLSNLLKKKDGQTSWDFVNLACSGATSPDIQKNQAQKLLDENLAYNLITISAGGNDLGFGDIVARCFYVVDGPNEKDPMSNCNEAFDNAKKIMKSSKFKEDLTALIKTAQGALHPSGHILVNGYSRFFDASTSDCNKVTWAGYKPNYEPIYLSKDIRQTANDLVDDVNKILQELVKSEPNTFFIDINDARKDLKPYCALGVDESHKMPHDQKWKTPSDSQFWQIEWTRRENGAFEMPSIFRTREFSWSNILPTDWITDLYKRTFHPSLEYHKQIAELAFEKYKGCLAAARPDKRNLRFSKRRTEPKIACDHSKSGGDKKDLDLTEVLHKIEDHSGKAALGIVDNFLMDEMPKDTSLEDWTRHLAPKDALKVYDDLKKAYGTGKEMSEGIHDLYIWLQDHVPGASSSKDDKDDSSSSKDDKDDSSKENEDKPDPYEPPEFQHPAAGVDLTELETWERDGVEKHQEGKCVYSVSGGGNMNIFAWDLHFLGPGTAEAVDDDKTIVSEGSPWHKDGMRPLIHKFCQTKSGIHKNFSKWDSKKGYTEQGSKRGWGRFMFFYRWAAKRCGENVLLHAAKAAQKHVLESQATVRYIRSRNYPSSQVLSEADKAIIRQDANRELAEKAKNPDKVFGSDFKCKKVKHADHEAAKDYPPNNVDNGPAPGPKDVKVEL